MTSQSTSTGDLPTSAGDSVRPNILLILADDFGYGDLGCSGNSAARTPHLDRLAVQGLSLRQHYSGSPVCAPARACLLTGRYPHRTGVVDLLWTYGRDRLGLDEVTLADRLRAEGYVTGLVGKWHLGAFDARYHPNRRGFDEFIGFHFALIDYYRWTLDLNGTQVRADGRYVTEVFTDEAVQFIRRHSRRGPFFLYLAYNAPHGPLQAPEDEVRPFMAAGLGRRTATIYAMNAVMDRGIGRVLEELDRLGQAENTIVIFASDNGPAPGHTGYTESTGPEFAVPRFNAGLRGHKYLVYEGGIRVPGLIRWPDGLPGGGAVDTVVHFSDWVPTLLAAAGVGGDPPHPLDGVNVLPALRGEDLPTGLVRCWQWNRYHPIGRYNTAVREGDWKLVFPALPEIDDIDPAEAERRGLVENNQMSYEEVKRLTPPEPDRSTLVAAHSNPPLLFNLSHDPYESTDLAPREPAITARLTAAHDQWWDSVKSSRRLEIS